MSQKSRNSILLKIQSLGINSRTKICGFEIFKFRCLSDGQVRVFLTSGGVTSSPMFSEDAAAHIAAC